MMLKMARKYFKHLPPQFNLTTFSLAAAIIFQLLGKSVIKTNPKTNVKPLEK